MWLNISKNSQTPDYEELEGKGLLHDAEGIAFQRPSPTAMLLPTLCIVSVSSVLLNILLLLFGFSFRNLDQVCQRHTSLHGQY